MWASPCPDPRAVERYTPPPTPSSELLGPAAGRTEPAPSLEERVGQDSPTVLYLPAVRDSLNEMVLHGPRTGQEVTD